MTSDGGARTFRFSVGPTNPDKARIGRYEVLRKIATGGMAELFVAKHVGMDGFEKVVALKRILSHLAFDEEFIAMFRDEARLVAKLNHPHIVQIYDLGKSDDSYFIAMEYIAGRNLSSIAKKARIRGESLPPVNIARCLAQACEGLFYAHTRKDADGRELEIIHRDVSPQNIIVSFSGSVKLVDFGIAKAASKVAHTRTGVLKGKYAYMSPEQIRGTSPIDARSDLFAVGIVLYELLCGRRPFEKDTSMQTLKAIVQEEPVPCRELNPEIPKRLAAIIHRCLEKNKDRRYASAQEVQVDLEDFVASGETRCNSITISQWLSSLFDGEISRENGGTVVFKGVGEVILPDVPAPVRPPIPAPSNRMLESPDAAESKTGPRPGGIDADDLLEEFTLDRPIEPAPMDGYRDDATLHTHESVAPDLSSSGLEVRFDAESSDLEVGEAWDQASADLQDLLRDLDDPPEASREVEGDATLAMPSISPGDGEGEPGLTAEELEALYDQVAADEGEHLPGDPTVGIGGGSDLFAGGVGWPLDGSGAEAAVEDPRPKGASSWRALDDEHTVQADESEPAAPSRGPRTDQLPPDPMDERTLDGITGDLVAPTRDRSRRSSEAVGAIALERREVTMDDEPSLDFEPDAAFEPDGVLEPEDPRPVPSSTTDDGEADPRPPSGPSLSHQDEYSALVAPASPLPAREASRAVESASSSRLQALPRPSAGGTLSTPSASRSLIGRQIREVVRNTSVAPEPSRPRTGSVAFVAAADPDPSPLPDLGTPSIYRSTWRSRLLTAVKTGVGVVALAGATYLVLLYLLPPEPLLEVSTDPPGATLRLNGALIPGTTPITLRLEPGTPYRLQLEREGYQTVADEVSVAPDQGRSSYRVKLEARP